MTTGWIRSEEYARVAHDIYDLGVKMLRSDKVTSGCLNLTDPIAIPAGTPLRKNDHRLVHDIHVSGLYISVIRRTFDLKYLENRITFRNAIGEEYAFMPGEFDVFRDIIPIGQLSLLRLRMRVTHASRFFNIAKFLGVERLMKRIVNKILEKSLAHLGVS